MIILLDITSFFFSKMILFHILTEIFCTLQISLQTGSFELNSVYFTKRYIHHNVGTSGNNNGDLWLAVQDSGCHRDGCPGDRVLDVDDHGIKLLTQRVADPDTDVVSSNPVEPLDITTTHKTTNVYKGLIFTPSLEIGDLTPRLCTDGWWSLPRK